MKFIKGLTVLIVVIVTLITAYYIFFGPSKEIERSPLREKEEGASYQDGSFTAKAPERVVPPQDRTGKKISVIIDDIGYNLSPLKELLKIDAPIAFAILPHCPQSVDAAEIIHGAEREILLHLPMEPHDSNKNPGPGALFRWMQEPEIRQHLEKDLNAVPYVVGVNNHMGSAFMEDEEKLNIVLQELKERGLFFIDSRTTPDSRAGRVAKKTKIRYASRKLFIDNNQDEEAILKNLIGYLEKHDRGPAVIIGHPYPETVKALRKAVPILKSMGITIVPPTEMVNTIGEAENINNKE